LQIIVDGGSDLSVRQSASIHFKNFIAKHWEPHSGNCLFSLFINQILLCYLFAWITLFLFCYAGDQNIILPSDKNVVRNQILVFVSQVPPILR